MRHPLGLVPVGKRRWVFVPPCLENLLAMGVLQQMDEKPRTDVAPNGFVSFEAEQVGAMRIYILHSKKSKTGHGIIAMAKRRREGMTGRVFFQWGLVRKTNFPNYLSNVVVNTMERRSFLKVVAMGEAWFAP